MDTDGTETQTDATLSDENTETPKEETQVTQTQLDKAVLDARTSALADVGRFQRESEAAVKAATAALDRTKKIRLEMDEIELQNAEGSSEQLSAVKERQKRRTAETELDEATLKLTQRDEELSRIKEDSAKATQGEKAREIATRLGIDADGLIRLSKFTDGSVEAMEELAKELPKKQAIREKIESDSNQGGGGGGGSSDATFLDKYGSGELPNTKENKERAEKLLK